MSGSSGKDRGARPLAYEVLWRCQRDGAYPELLLSSRLKSAPSLARVDRSLARELIFGTLRWQLSLDMALGRVCHRPIDQVHPRLLVILRMGAYQILFLDRIPSPAAVNESVNLAKNLGLTHAATFVNGVLREVARKGTDLLEVDSAHPLPQRISLETSHPRWMVDRWLGQWGESETRALCKANNEVPPLTVRANTLRITRHGLARSLEQEGVESEPAVYSPVGLRITRLPGAIAELQSFQRGEFQVQDEASQLMAYWLDVSPGDQILDACAAPGGKTTHLAQLAKNKGKIVAADIHKGRLGLVEENCSRLGVLNVLSCQLDLTDSKAIPAGPYQRILLDAPCSGLGVLRRHPDAKWRETEEVVGTMAETQLALLGAVIQHLSPGGILLYSVCTHTSEETDGVLDKILKDSKDIRLLTSTQGLPAGAKHLVGEDGIFRSSPRRHGMDGFTAFRLQRL